MHRDFGNLERCRQCRLVPLATVVVALLGCAGGVPLAEIAPRINETYHASPMTLAVGDMLEVRFPHLPEFNHTSQVQRAGKASFLFLDEVPCAGLTLAELDALLTSAYGEHLASPELTLSLLEPAPRSVFVLGEVRAGGSVPFPPGELSLLEAIGIAGGPTKDTASLKNVLLVRWLPETRRRRVWHIDLRPTFWEGSERILLLANDTIIIPNTPIDKVNIWVNKYIRQLIPIPVPVPVN